MAKLIHTDFLVVFLLIWCYIGNLAGVLDINACRE